MDGKASAIGYLQRIGRYVFLFFCLGPVVGGAVSACVLTLMGAVETIRSGQIVGGLALVLWLLPVIGVSIAYAFFISGLSAAVAGAATGAVSLFIANPVARLSFAAVIGAVAAVAFPMIPALLAESPAWVLLYALCGAVAGAVCADQARRIWPSSNLTQPNLTPP